MQATCDMRFEAMAAHFGHRFDAEIKIGGHYVPVLRHGAQVFVSVQIPRVGAILVVGRVGVEVTLAEARFAAPVCAMRALALLRQSRGSLEVISQVLRLTVVVQSAADFTQHSEVVDAASDVLHTVLGDAAATRARRSVCASCRRTPRWNWT
jgi:enamine deaminase RidA (YjgF/YER057c/UK114 family)